LTHIHAVLHESIISRLSRGGSVPSFRILLIRYRANG
jgi:hypothetical protein